MNNIHNKLIKKINIEKLVNKFINIYELKINNLHFDSNIKINNIKNIQKAFIHKSFTITENESDSDSYSCIKLEKYIINNYERIEFLGDKVIDLIIAEYLFDKFPEKDQGFLTELKSRLVRKETLAILATHLKFNEYLLISSHIERTNGRDNPRILEDVFESFVGALSKDQGGINNIIICKKFIIGLYLEYIDLNEMIMNNTNHKSALLNYFHSMKYDHPVYHTLYYEGNTFSRIFTTVVLIPKSKYIYDETINLIPFQKRIMKIVEETCKNESCNNDNASKDLQELMKNNVLVGYGTGSTKKESEQNCSLDCLGNLKANKD